MKREGRERESRGGDFMQRGGGGKGRDGGGKKYHSRGLPPGKVSPPKQVIQKRRTLVIAGWPESDEDCPGGK
jgi:hypothetical protein